MTLIGVHPSEFDKILLYFSKNAIIKSFVTENGGFILVIKCSI